MSQNNPVSLTSMIQSSVEMQKPLTRLLNVGCWTVGGIYHLNYSTATVLTDDAKKSTAGGVPKAGFLLAAAGSMTGDGFVLSDQEVILLRVRGTASLPNEGDLIQTRLAVVRDADAAGVDFDQVTDVLTRNELQQSAFDCEVLGTFFTREDKADAPIFYGSDIDNVMVSAKYQVFLPSAKVLSWLASYAESNDETDTLPIGKVRFSSTQRKALVAGTDEAAVNVHVGDFVGRKTAVFGMTRTGKSNTIKTLVTAVHQYANERSTRIGQLIFDPQGEYANVNRQDGTGLRWLGDDDSTVRIYKVEPDATDVREKDLRINFYDPEILDAVWSLVSDSVTEATANYAKNFRSVMLEEPDTNNDRSAHTRWQWTLIGFYGLLAKCGFGGAAFAKENSLAFTMKDDLATAFLDKNVGLISGGSGRYRLRTPQAALALTTWVGARETEFPKWFDETCDFKHVYGVFGYTGITSSIRMVRDFHDPTGAGDVSEQIWDDMVNGRLAIVDLSSGNDEVAKTMSERIVTYLLERASQQFRTNQENRTPVQIVVEEAHNLFERGDKNRSASSNPWVRLSKEAAKYQIGLIYATQEVTSVDKRILSNTSNWLIAHLNSDHETRELAHYYDFSVWAESLVRVEDVGFVRMKTYSGKYVVPVQISKFDHDMLNTARRAAGLADHHFADPDATSAAPDQGTDTTTPAV